MQTYFSERAHFDRTSAILDSEDRRGMRTEKQRVLRRRSEAEGRVTEKCGREWRYLFSSPLPPCLVLWFQPPTFSNSKMAAGLYMRSALSRFHRAKTSALRAKTFESMVTCRKYFCITTDPFSLIIFM